MKINYVLNSDKNQNWISLRGWNLIAIVVQVNCIGRKIAMIELKKKLTR